MTESEWHTSGDVRAMLAFVEPTATDRRLRLFVLACCRRLWGESEDEHAPGDAVRRAVGARAGSMTSRKMTVPGGEAVLECGASEYLGGIRLFGSADENVSLLQAPVLESALIALGCSHRIHVRMQDLVGAFEYAGFEAGEQAELLRDVVRPPYRLYRFLAHWRAANDGAVRHLAAQIERDEAFDVLPMLADALMDAGRDCDIILDHLQGFGPHVRGCWALDVVLGRC